MEKKILAAILRSREHFLAVAGHLNPLEELSPEGALIFELVKDYYETDGSADTCDVDIIRARAERKLSSPKHVEAFGVYLSSVGEQEVSGVNIVREVLDQKHRAVGLKLASKLVSNSSPDDVKKLTRELSELQTASSLGREEEDEEEYHGVRPQDLLTKHFDRKNLIEVWPKTLNDQIDGGAKPGHHILVFAPTEMGKTLMVINMVAGFLRFGHKVLYIGNEDPAPDIIMRAMSRITGMTKYEIEANPDEAQKRLSARNWSLFTLASLAPGTFDTIQKLVDRYKPTVVVLDQLRNINVDSENRTQALEKAATSARNLAKRNEVLVVSVSQAADSASGKTVLGRGDVDGSNVGIPGQCDLMIGIGADPHMEEQGLRVLSFPKNKLSGRHTPIPVTFNYALSRVEV